MQQGSIVQTGRKQGANMSGAALAPMNSLPIRRCCASHTTKRFGEVALIGKAVLYSDVGERATAVQ